MEKMLLVILLCAPLLSDGQKTDQTLQPNARGVAVVDAVLDRIRSTCILSDDKYMMKRIAAVETDYGQNSAPNTGGIWKVSKSILSSIKSNCQSGLRPICNGIMQTFFFDVTKATMAQMDIPLYSALVLHLYISHISDSGKPIPASKSDQAVYWSKYINPNGNKTDFIDKSSIQVSCTAVKMELVFAIDASGSVGKTNFNKTLTFLEKVVGDLHIAPDLTRVAVIRFSSRPTINFKLDTYKSESEVISGIRRIKYTGGGTVTATAIDLARTSVFNNSRPNVPKVFVLITDGKSNNMKATVAAADKLKDDRVTVFTIGVGNVNPREMLAVASLPNCVHFFSLTSYTEIDAIIQEIQKESCEAPVAVNIIDNPGGMNTTEENDNTITDNQIPKNKTKTQTIDLAPSNVTDKGNNTDGNTGNTTNIKVEVTCGIVHIYASNDFNKPSAALFTYKALATDHAPGWIHSPADKRLFLSLVSKALSDQSSPDCDHPHYNISFNPPDEQGGVEIMCRENGKDRPCTSEDIKLKFGTSCDDEDNVPNPCTRENILKNIMHFEHPDSTTKYIQCKPTGKMEIVKCPKETQYDKSQMVCDPKTTGIPQSNNGKYKGSNPCNRQAIMNGQFYFADPSDETYFIQCNEWGVAFHVKCPNGTVWSPQAYTCIQGTISHANACESPNARPYHENPNDRKSFIQCSNGRALVVQCPFGTAWSEVEVKCIPDLIGTGLPSNQNYTTANAVSCLPTTRKADCPYGELIPHKDPSKYNICGPNGVLTEMTCPAGLVWHQAMKICNWPSGSAQIPS